MRFVNHFLLLVVCLFTMNTVCAVGISIYDKDGLNWQNRESIEIDGAPFQRALLSEPLYSDHELMLITLPQINGLTYNILQQMAVSERPNNALLLSESAPAYRLRLTRLVNRLAQAAQRENVDFMMLQEAPYAPEDTRYFNGLIAQALSDFALFRAGSLNTLVKKALLPIDLMSNVYLDEAVRGWLEAHRIQAIFIPDHRIVLVNLHLPWKAKGDHEANQRFEDVMRAFIAQIRQHPDMAKATFLLSGDWNREDYTVQDRRFTLDMSEIAQGISKEAQLYTAQDYTNLRYHGDISNILTASDHLVLIPPSISN